jgi:leucyl-tRNA synthetase
MEDENHLLMFERLIEGRIYTGAGILTNSGKFDGMDSEEAKKAITKFVGGRITHNYRLRDWSVSRQRYWGAPIPIVYDPQGKAHAIPEEHLPWKLPEDVDFMPTGTAPLAKSEELKKRTEKLFGKGWTPEVETLDTFVCSSWYYLRYPDPHNDKAFCDKKLLKRWLPVDLYIGGAEHTYLHLLYARFFTRAMHKLKLLSFDEPFVRLRHQGMILDEKGAKMSKSKGNVVNPETMVERFGADAVRMYMMFAGPLEDDVMWNEKGVVGTYRFLEKIWRMSDDLSKTTPEVERELHKTIKGVGEDIEALKYNTAIAKMMTLSNAIKGGAIGKKGYESFLKVLAPFAPHITDELWEMLGHKRSIHLEEWPEYDKRKLASDTVTIAIQVNGKLRDQVEAPADASENDVTALAKEREQVKKWVGDKEIKKAVYVPGRLLYLVV